MTAPTFALDSSCMVAAVCSWHEHHARALGELNRRLNRQEEMVVAAPALIETYAVLTRLPAPHRLSADDALALIEANFLRGVRSVALDSRSYERLLRGAPALEVRGGSTYDAVIAMCAIKASASVLLTFNERHFRRYSEEGLEVIVP